MAISAPPAVPLDRAALARSRGSAQGRLRWELLAQLVRKDLKVKYQGSALGFAWSLANPILLMGIYYLVFGVFFKNETPAFAIMIMCGLLPWTAFSAAVTTASGTVVGNAGLVKKVRFPLQVLPLSAVGYAVVHFVLQLGVLLVATTVFRPDLSPAFLLIIPALGLLLLFSTALAYLVSALNVRYRDTAHVVEIAMLVWFWLNPILYPARFMMEPLARHHLYWTYFLNPMATVVSTFQRAIYVEPYYWSPSKHTRLLDLADPGYTFYLRNLAIGFVIAGLLMVFARRVFTRMQADFAEEL